MTDEQAADAKQDKDVLQEKVDECKKAHPENLPELDYALLLKALDQANENSPVKIARNALNEKREWVSGTDTYNVSNVYLSDDRSVTFVLSHGNKEMTIAELNAELDTINKHLPMKNVPIMIELTANSHVKATELYAHSLVTSMWAGLPVDFVLCYTQKREKKVIPSSI